MWVAEKLFLPIMCVFTLVNSDLRKILSDKVTLNCVIINNLRCHLSFVTFAITLSSAWFCNQECTLARPERATAHSPGQAKRHPGSRICHSIDAL